jgi:NADPH-dependent glutamate synthase beta subunit-like oxidoreductase
VAVLGAANVAPDIARILAKPADEQLGTEIPGNVYRGLALNQATDVHVFARRGPAQIKFTPMEFRELSHSPSIDVIVHPEGFTTWREWERLDAHEVSRGREQGRERVKVVPLEDMIRSGRG